MRKTFRQLAGVVTLVGGAAILGACSEQITPPNAANSAPSAVDGRQLQPGTAAKSMDPCPGGTCDDPGGGGGGVGPTTYLTGFADAAPATHDYYAIEFNFKNRYGSQVGTTKEQRWHGDSFATNEVSSVDVGAAMPCGGKVQVEFRRAHFGATTWEAAGSVFVLSTQSGQFVQYYDPTRGVFGIVRLTFTGCV
jgi:hypothetical protein